MCCIIIVILLFYLTILFCFWFLAPTVCNSFYNSTNGTIQSPNYPYDYSNYLDCYYTIYTKQTANVTITLFFYYFWTEAVYDYVSVRNTFALVYFIDIQGQLLRVTFLIIVWFNLCTKQQTALTEVHTHTHTQYIYIYIYIYDISECVFVCLCVCVCMCSGVYVCICMCTCVKLCNEQPMTFVISSGWLQSQRTVLRWLRNYSASADQLYL